MHLTPCVYQGFLQQIHTQIEDECADDHDRNKTDNDWSCKKDTKRCSGQHYTSNSTVPSASHEKHRIGVYEIILFDV